MRQSVVLSEGPKRERGVDGQLWMDSCGWQPAKPLQLCSHVNNKQENCPGVER